MQTIRVMTISWKPIITNESSVNKRNAVLNATFFGCIYFLLKLVNFNGEKEDWSVKICRFQFFFVHFAIQNLKFI